MHVLPMIAAVCGLYRRPQSEQIVVSRPFGTELVTLGDGPVVTFELEGVHYLHVGDRPIASGPEDHIRETQAHLLALREGQSVVIEGGSTIGFAQDEQSYHVLTMEHSYKEDLEDLKDILLEMEDLEMDPPVDLMRDWFLSSERIADLWEEYRGQNAIE